MSDEEVRDIVRKELALTVREPSPTECWCYRAGAASRDAEVERWTQLCRRLVTACTPTRIPADEEYRGVRCPDRAMLEHARAALAAKAGT